VHQLTTTTTGIVALAAAAVAVVGLLLSAGLALRLRRVRVAQRALLGDGRQDLVEHAANLQAQFEALHQYLEDAARALHARMERVEGRLDGTIAHRALVHYDAWGEMSGQQSTSIALLDATGSGLVLSSIHHRDQARLYAKQVRDGSSDHELSPEENEAIQLALGRAGDQAQPA
jgi:autotransporter translocation and assembly factor TamB